MPSDGTEVNAGQPAWSILIPGHPLKTSSTRSGQCQPRGLVRTKREIRINNKSVDRVLKTIINGRHGGEE
ncbi:hypothetical protein RRG08_026266 [Elysia crispata]|uniref:Uncharacterized protein n=1 Tax=Elysia crispata TaxID=231223 RepID=A0AAE1DCT6_9GAST|nr:hypothetical protein RRG08_026266 [Elysia crispata]